MYMKKIYYYLIKLDNNKFLIMVGKIFVKKKSI